MEKSLSAKLYEQAVQVAKHNVNTLILGETGSGKEVLADFIQNHSERSNKPYVKLNCAAIPETLIESELFGHEKGAFTGADRKKEGKLEAAHTGIILLDEIGDMPVGLQPRLLRVTDGAGFNRIGSNEEINVDVRFISSTHINIEQAIENKRFRSDLYYRLSGAVLVIPPLRERKDEILKVANHILQAKSMELDTEVVGFTPEACEAMLDYHWPGNFRELENCILSAAIKSSGTYITKDDLFSNVRQKAEAGVGSIEKLNLLDIEKEVILEALKRCNWRQSEASLLLGITPRVLNYKIKLMGITHPKWKVHN